MARKPVRKKESSSLGPQIVTILLVVAIFGFLVTQFFKVEEQLAKLHQEVFNSTEVVTKYSFSPSEFALIITTNLKSKPLPANEKLKGFPILSVPLKYKIVHFVGPTLHRGTIELKLSENEALTEAFAADVKTEFIVIDDSTLEITNPELVYKTLDKEIKFGKTRGRISFSGRADLTFDELEYSDAKYKVKLTQISMMASKTEQKLQLKAQALSLNGIDISAPILSIQKSAGGQMTFKGMYKELPIDASFQTEVQEVSGKKVPLQFGTFSLPVSFFDAAFNPIIDAQIKRMDEAVASRNDPKKSYLYSLAKDSTRKAMKIGILQGFTHPKNIKVTKDLYIISLPKEDKILKLGREIKEQSDVKKLADDWLKIPGNAKFEEAISRIIFPREIYYYATSILLKKLENTERNNPLYMTLRARYILWQAYDDQKGYDPKMIEAVKDIASTVNQLSPDHKHTYLLNMKLARITKDVAVYESNFQKFQEKETDPQIKTMFHYLRTLDKDKNEALRLLESANQINPNHFIMADYYDIKASLHGSLNDKVAQESAYKALVDRPEPHYYDWINYSKFLINQSRFEEARPMVEKCYAITNPGNYCHEFMERLTIERAYEKVKAGKIDEAISDLESLLELRPVSMGLHFALGWIYAKKDKEKSLDYYAKSCAFEASNGCHFAGDYLYYEKKDIEKSLTFFELACDKNLALGCMKAGYRLEQKGQPEKALPLFTKSCHQLKDEIGCYHQARIFQQLKRPKEEIASHLDMVCPRFKAVCKLSAMIKSGNNTQLPMHPPNN